MKITLMVLMVLLSMCSSYGQQEATGCELQKGAEIPIIFEKVSEKANSMGLSDEFLKNKVELQFRRNGLKPTYNTRDYNYFCHIYVHVVASAVSIRVEFNRGVKYWVKSREFHKDATVYQSLSTGSHNGEKEKIVTALLDHIDLLSNEILKSSIDIPETKDAASIKQEMRKMLSVSKWANIYSPMCENMLEQSLLLENTGDLGTGKDTPAP